MGSNRIVTEKMKNVVRVMGLLRRDMEKWDKIETKLTTGEIQDLRQKCITFS